MEHQQIGKQEPEILLRKGPWLEDEDEALMAAVSLLGERRWETLAKASGLRRSGKSCRLRWMNYLRPNLKHGHITEQEENLIIQLHKQWGNRWSRIARSLPGRTDNEIKNYWRSHLRKKASLLHQGAEQSLGSNTANNWDQNSAVGGILILGQDFSASSSSCSDTGEYVFDRKDDDLRSCAADFSGTVVDELSSIGLNLIAYSPYETTVLLDWNSSKMETLGDECGYINDVDTTLISIWDMD